MRREYLFLWPAIAFFVGVIASFPLAAYMVDKQRAAIYSGCREEAWVFLSIVSIVDE